MSFILDALKKSEAERQRQAGPALLEMRVVRPQRRIPLWLVVLGAVLIIFNLGGLLWLMLRSSPGAQPAAPAPVAQSNAGTVTGGATGVPGGTVQLAPGERLIVPGTLGAAGSVANDGNVPLLAGSDETTSGAEINPADFVPAAASERTRPRGVTPRNYADIRNTLPALRLDLHVYDNSPARRYVFVNMKRLGEGESTAEGARVVEITREGAVMSYRNTEFLLTSDSTPGQSTRISDR